MGGADATGSTPACGSNQVQVTSPVEEPIATSSCSSLRCAEGKEEEEEEDDDDDDDEYEEEEDCCISTTTSSADAAAVVATAGGGGGIGDASVADLKRSCSLPPPPRPIDCNVFVSRSLPSTMFRK